MDADATALSALSTNYLNNYLTPGGGVLTKAQQAQSAADLAQMNTSQLLAGSKSEAAQVNNVAQQENAINAQGSTANRAQAQALAIKKAAMQMMISHTNHMTAIQRQKLQQGVQNASTNAALQLQQEAQQARQNQMSIYETGRYNTNRGGLGVATALANAGALGGATIAAQLNAPVSSGTYGGADLNSVTAQQTGDTYSGGTGNSAGYAAPSYTLTPGSSVSNTAADSLASGLSRLSTLQGSQQYNPFSTSDTSSSQPAASAWGMSSLNNTLPS